ncbi:MAG: TrkH family potassium uptake protein [Desulfurococcales archaeon]|nr:TrkH family potassium uptake protein [Desulfurococcales archaeon]
MNWRGILKTIAGLEGILGLLMFSVPLIDILSGHDITLPFVYGGLFFSIIGILSNKIEAKPLTLIDSLVVVSIAWPLISFEGAIALMFSVNMPLVDSWFESISGFTGTGFTVMVLEGVKPSIVTWRSIMQWSGELGFVVFAMVIFPYFYKIGRSAYGVERPVKIEASFYKTAISLVKIYLALTIMGLISYIYTGMNIYEAFNHILTTIATGGMSTYDAGYQVIFERVPLTYIPVMVFMFIGGMNFYIIAKMFRGDLKSVIKSEEFKTYMYSMFLLIAFTILSYIYVDKYDIVFSLIAGPFNLVSAMTTTGYSIGSIAKLSDTTKAIIIFSMFLGGMMFSTAGGIKSMRLLIAVKKFKDMVMKSVISAPVERHLAIDGIPLTNEETVQATIFILFHALAIFIGATLISAYGYPFIDSLFEATSAAGCVGLSVNIVNPNAPVVVKLTIMALMILGRIEYTQLVLLFALISGKKAMRILY